MRHENLSMHWWSMYKTTKGVVAYAHCDQNRLLALAPNSTVYLFLWSCHPVRDAIVSWKAFDLKGGK